MLAFEPGPPLMTCQLEMGQQAGGLCQPPKVEGADDVALLCQFIDQSKDDGVVVAATHGRIWVGDNRT